MAAIERGVADGVQVMNHSYGDPVDPGPMVKAAFDNAYAAGVLHVGAAGNNGDLFGTGDNCIYPARWETVIATAATMQDDTRLFGGSELQNYSIPERISGCRSTKPATISGRFSRISRHCCSNTRFNSSSLTCEISFFGCISSAAVINRIIAWRW